VEVLVRVQLICVVSTQIVVGHFSMHTVSLDHAKQQLEAVIARVLADAEPTVVNTPAGESVVVVPLDDYEAWQETAYLLRNPANAAHLRKAIAEADAGKVLTRDLLD
jgi:antitoxin YefM